MLETIKLALRISHDKLDAELLRLIETAKAELIRAGVPEETIAKNGSLITQAVTTYCLMNLTDDIRLIDHYQKAFEIQVDSIRRSSNVQ